MHSNTQTQLPVLITFSAVARKLDIPLPRASRLMREGVLKPDFQLGKRVLFLETRVGEIARAVRNHNHRSTTNIL